MLALRFGIDGSDGGGMRIHCHIKYVMDPERIQIVLVLRYGWIDLLCLIIIQIILSLIESECALSRDEDFLLTPDCYKSDTFLLPLASVNFEI